MGLVDHSDPQGLFTVESKTVLLKICKDPLERVPLPNYPRDIYPIVRSIFEDLPDDQEHCVALALGNEMEFIGHAIVASGLSCSAPVDSKVLFRRMLVMGASRVIVAHNHPTANGDLQPSPDDMSATRVLKEQGDLLGLTLFDHIIVGSSGKCLSIRYDNHKGGKPTRKALIDALLSSVMGLWPSTKKENAK